MQLQLPAASQDEDSDEARLNRGQLVKLRLEVIGLAASEEKFAGMLSKHIAGAEAKRAGIQKLAARVEAEVKALADFMGEPPSKDPAIIFGTLWEFTQRFDEAFTDMLAQGGADAVSP